MGVLYWGESPEQQVNIANSLRLAQVFCEKMASINVCNMVICFCRQREEKSSVCLNGNVTAVYVASITLLKY